MELILNQLGLEELKNSFMAEKVNVIPHTFNDFRVNSGVLYYDVGVRLYSPIAVARTAERTRCSLHGRSSSPAGSVQTHLFR